MALEWVEWRIGVGKLECGVRVGMFAGCAVFEELVLRVRIEGDMRILGIMGNNGDSGYRCGFLGIVGSFGDCV